MTTRDDLLGGLTRDEWDVLARDHFYSSSAWLQLCARTPGPRPTAAVVRLGPGTTGAVPVAEIGQPVAGNYDWNRPLAANHLPCLPTTGLLVGPTLAYHTHLLAGANEPDLTAALLEEVRRSAHGGACVLMYSSTADVLALQRAGVRTAPVLLEPEAWFPVPAGDWEDWLASLRQHRRHRVRQDVRRLEKLGHRVSHDVLAKHVQRVVPLAVELAQKLRYDPSPSRFEAEFGRYVEVTGDAAKVALCEDADGELVSFCLYYVWGDTIYLRWSASRYSRLTGGGAEYFNTAYYSQARLATQIGARWMHAGKQAIAAKVLRGAVLRPLWMLDLSEHSPLVRADADVRAHNARILRGLRTDAVTTEAISDPAEWAPFC